MPVRDDQKYQVQQATDIVGLIGEHILLRQKGREYLGLCPFHEDKNPSMNVSPAKQIYKCFSCGAGGDVFSWMMNYHKMTFPEALKHLAQRAHIELAPAASLRDGGPASRSDAAASDRELIAEANAQALRFYQHMLLKSSAGAVARDYLARRAVSDEMLKAFQLGYAPDEWEGLVGMIGKKGWRRRGFELAGLIKPRSTGDGLFDVLRHRVIFPICDALGRPIAFGGRKIRDEDEPKYLNSPETALFNKSGTLYGLHLGKQAIMSSRVAVIVEGYTDVIACHQAGAANVVATLGTALTGEHVRLLKRFCDKVVLIFDADEAGQKAADRAVEVFLRQELDVGIAVVPDGKDPADLMALPDGRARWDGAVAAAADALGYQFARVRDQLDAAETVTGRQRAAEDFVRRIAALGLEKTGPIRKAIVMQQLADLLHLSEQAVRSLVRRFTPARPMPVASRAPASGNKPGLTSLSDPAPRGDAGSGDSAEKNALSDVESVTIAHKIAIVGAEKQLMGCLLREPGLFHTVTLGDGRPLDEAVTAQELVTAEGKELYRMMYDLLADGRDLTLSGLLADIAPMQRADLAALATDAERMVERWSSSDRPIDLADKARRAADALADHHRRMEYQRKTRPAATNNTSAPDDEGLRQAIEYQKASPSKLNIMRADR